MAEIGGRRLSWREAGSGPALVLLHGLGGHSAAWAPQFEAFSPDYRVIAWDAPGYGGSDLDPRPDGVEDYGDALVALLAHLEIEPENVVGHSLGALMAAALARRALAVRRMIFLHGVVGGGVLDPQQRETMRLGRIADLQALGARGFAEQRGRAILGSGTAPERQEEIVHVMAEVPAEGYLAAWDVMCAASIFTDLALVRCPVLVLCGSEDPVAPETMCRSVAEALAHAQFELLPKIGHYGSLEAPDVVNDRIRTFLSADFTTGACR